MSDPTLAPLLHPAEAGRAWSPPALVLPELGSAAPVDVAAAPAAPDFERGWLSAVLPGLSTLGMLGFALLSPNVLIIAIMGGVAVVSTVGMVYSGRLSRRRHRQQWAGRCGRYRRHLAECDETLTESAHRQLAHAELSHPAPDTAVEAVARGQIWQSALPTGGLQLRLGTGRAPARRSPELSPQNPDADADPDLQRAADALVGRRSAVDAIPICLELADRSVAVLPADQLPGLRAFIVSLARAYRPEIVRLHVLAAPAESGWLRKLPHTVTISRDLAELRLGLRATPLEVGPHHLLIDATGDTLEAPTSLLPNDRDVRASLLALRRPGQETPQFATLLLDTSAEGGLLVTRLGSSPQSLGVTRPDSLSFAAAEAFAQAISRRAASSGAPAADGPLQLAALFSPPVAHPLMIPIGRDDDGERTVLDLREAASGGHGPHGLIIGCTGSGKSELLRTLLVAAAHQSSPTQLALLLVDYKGGAAFAELSRLPHVAGLLTNLSADPAAVDRMCASLRAELRRRQQLLRSVGAADIDSYRSSQFTKERLPRLLVVVDEYAELIEESPETLEVLTSLGRLGRSLGIHLLLSSQRLDDGRLRGLDAHLRLRVCLRTLNSSDSISVIGSPAAAKLPSAPGRAWLSRDGVLTSIRVALADPGLIREDEAARVTPVCLPPLPEAICLDGLPGDISQADPQTAPVGLLDLPEHGAQCSLVLDLRGADAHLAIAGAPRSGRSTALAGVVSALACTTSPRELSLHVITAAGSPLTGVSGLPHVGTVATTPELARRVLLTVAGIVSERQRTGGGYDSRLMLVIDDLATWLSLDDEINTALVRIASVGLSVGVSLALSCSRWLELRGGLREAIGTRWELRLNDPSDSQLPAVARRVGTRPPGRILTSGAEWAQLALPRFGALASSDDTAAALSVLVASVARRGGPATRPITLLPDLVPAQSLPTTGTPERIALGVSGPYADPAEVSLGPGDHFLVLGNSRTGRSGLLRAIALAAAGAGSQVWLIDPRHTQDAPAGGHHRHASNSAEIASLIEALAATCRQASRAAPGPVSQLLLIDDLELAEGRDGGTVLGPLADLLPSAAELRLTIVVARRASGSSRAAYNAFYGRFLEFCESGLVLSGDPAEGPVLGGLRPARRPVGRADLILRGEFAGELQTAWQEPADVAGRNGQIPAKSGANPHDRP